MNSIDIFLAIHQGFLDSQSRVERVVIAEDWENDLVTPGDRLFVAPPGLPRPERWRTSIPGLYARETRRSAEQVKRQRHVEDVPERHTSQYK